MASNISLVESNQWQSNLTKVRFSATTFGDLDNDNDIDLILTGCLTSGALRCDAGVIAKVYINNGTTLTENQQWQQNLTGVGHSSLALGDIDADGNLDLALSGCDNSSAVTLCEGNRYSKIYINNGTSLVESSQWQRNLTAVAIVSLAFGDIDNDGKLDLTLTGSAASGYISKIYINNGSTLTESNQWQSNLTAIRSSSTSLNDIDDDGDLDLDVAGYDGSSWISKIYLNNGSSLVENSIWEQNFGNWGWPENVYGDIDNDGDLDLIRTGTLAGDHMYYMKNNGSTFLVNQTNDDSPLVGFFDGSLAFGDYDNDGDLDLGAMGRDMEAGRDRIYENNQTIFIVDSIAYANITNNIKDGSLAWIDFDNDTDLDLIMIGSSVSIGLAAKVYISNASLTKNNTQPLAPTSGFSSSYVNNVLTLSWSNGSDTETNTSGLYYNLKVGNVTNNNSIVSGVYGGSSNPTAGYFGNMMQRKSIRLNVQLEANKTYYWYVQTIDTGLQKSNWSALQTFNTSLDVTKPNITINYPSPNASLHTSNPYFIFNATVTDANLTNVTLNANWSGSWHINQSNSSGINGTYTFSANLTNNNDGHYAWYIGANDSSNNSETSGIRDFFLDRAYPLVYLVSPANGASWTSSSTITFSYNVSDVDIANCSLIIDNSIDQTDTIISVNINQTFTKTLANGNYNWNVNCTDYVGYTNSSAIRSLTVNYVAPSSSGGGGGGGGGTSITTNTYTATNEQLIQGYTQQLANNDKIKFSINNINHSLTVNNISSDNVNLTLNSIAINFVIYVNETRKFELTNDSYYDLLVKLNSIESNKANLTIKSTYEEISKEKIGKEAKAEEAEKEEIKKKKLLFWVILVVIAVILIVLIKFLRSYIKYKKWRKYSFVG